MMCNSFVFSFSILSDVLPAVCIAVLVSALTVGLIAAHLKLKGQAKSSPAERGLVRCAPCGMVEFRVRDGVCSIVFANDSFYELLEFTEKEYIEKFGSDMLALIVKTDAERTLSSIFSAARQRRPIHAEFRVTARDGSIRWLLLNAAPSKGDYLNAPLYFGVLVENSDLMQETITTARQKKSIENLTNSVSGAVITLSADDLLTVRYANDGFYDIIGRSAEESAPDGTIHLKAFIHPDDCERTCADITSQIAESGRVKLEFRILCEDHDIKWIHMEGSADDKSDNSDGHFLSCVIVDITDSKRAQLDLAFEKERYRILVEHSKSIIWEYDIATDTMTRSKRSPGGSKFITVRDFRTKLSQNIIHPDSKSTFFALCDMLTSGDKDIYTELRAKDGTGGYSWFSVSATTVFDSQGNPLRVLGQSVNIDSERREFDELREKSELDPLTGLYNRGALEEKISSVLEQADPENGDMLALIVIDVDNFKLVNDRLGHLFGDAVLIELAETLKRMLPDNIIGRIGGDEFVLLAQVGSGSLDVASRISELSSCINRYCTGEEHTEPITCSVGVSMFPQDGRTYDALFGKADIALYNTKFNGKMGYSIYSPSMDEQLSVSAVRRREKKIYNNEYPFKSSSLLFQAIEILFDSRDLESSISIILSMVGHKFNLDRAAIVEFSEDGSHSSVTHEWAAENYRPLTSDFSEIPADMSQKFVFLSEREYFVCNDIYKFVKDSPELSDIVDMFGLKSLIQCSVIDSGTLRGHIDYGICSEHHQWMPGEINELVLLSKIIGGYLVRLRTKQDIDRMAYSDRLTGAWNLNRFKLEAESLLLKDSAEKHVFASLDIDRFKFLNEKYGYSAGDNILKSFSSMIAQFLQPGEIFARVIADRFVILMKYESGKTVIDRLNELIANANRIKKNATDFYKLSLRFGLYWITPGDSDISFIIDKANIARKSIKNLHVSTIISFDEGMKNRIREQKEIEDVMRDSLRNNEFIVYLQPKFSIADNTAVGAEALVRWQRPGYGLVPPGEFVPIFEDNGFIVNLDFFVLDFVCSKIRRDIDLHRCVIPISVNFSRVHLRSPNLVGRIKEYIEKYDIPPNLLEVEITESALTENEDYLFDIIQELHNLGIIVSMDDFGSGYSSLNLLKKLPFDVLKIDKNFFANGHGTERERTIIASVVSLAKSLDIRVVSEGVETEEQAAFLREINCDQAQGRLYARPMPSDVFEKQYQEKQI